MRERELERECERDRDKESVCALRHVLLDGVYFIYGLKLGNFSQLECTVRYGFGVCHFLIHKQKAVSTDGGSFPTTFTS